MRRIALAFLIASGIVAASPPSSVAGFFSAISSLGRGGTGVTPIGACIMGVFVGAQDDGCQEAPAPLTASFGRTNVLAPGGYLNTTAGTTANYTNTNCGPGGNLPCHQPFNQAGNGDQGYRIGFVTPLGNSSSGVACAPATVASGACIPTCTKTTFDGTCLLDPALMSVAGCTYAPGNGVIGNTNTTLGSVPGGGPELDCEGGSFLGSLQNFDLGPVNGHSCTTIRMLAPTTVNVLLNNFFFFDDSGLCSTLGIAINIGVTLPLSVTISNFEMNGNSSRFRDTLGAPGCVSANVNCNPVGMISAGFGPTEPLHVRYGAVYDMAYYAFGTSNIDAKFSWIEGGCGSAATCHAEWLLAQASSGHIAASIDHTTALGIARQSQFSPGPLFFSVISNTVDALTLTNDTLINPFIGGVTNPSSVVSGCIGQPPTGGTATAPTCGAGSGAIFYQTSTTPNVVGQGTEIPGGECGSSVGGGLGPPIPGAYPISLGSGIPDIQGEWFIDGFSPQATSVGGYALNSLTSLSGPNTGGTFTLPSAVCSGIAVNAQIGSSATFSNHAPAPTGQITIQNVLSDFSSQADGGYYSWDGGTPSSFWASINGTAMLGVTAIAFNTGDLIFSSSIAACETSLLDCPSIVTGGTYPSTGTPTGAPLSGSAINVTLGSLRRYVDNTPSGFTGTLTNYAAVAAGGVTGAAYNSTTGELDLTFATAPFGAGIGSTNDGANFTVAGLTGTGVSSLNGTFPILNTSSSGTVVGLQAATGLGSLTIGTSSATTAALSVLTTTTAQTLTAGRFIYDASSDVCSSVDPATCPTIVTTKTSAQVFNTTTANSDATSVTLNEVQLAATFTGTINNASPGAIAAGNVLLQAAAAGAINGNNGGLAYIPVPSCGYTTGLDPAHPITNCPILDTTPAPPQTSYVLDSSGGTVGGVNSFVLSSAHFPVICANTSIISGNFDMADLLSPSLLNPNFNTTPQFDQVGC